MQLKYPTFPGRLSSYQAGVRGRDRLCWPVTDVQLQCMYREHCYFSTDYNEEVRHISNARNLANMDRVVQFPFVPLVSLYHLSLGCDTKTCHDR